MICSFFMFRFSFSFFLFLFCHFHFYFLSRSLFLSLILSIRIICNFFSIFLFLILFEISFFFFILLKYGGINRILCVCIKTEMFSNRYCILIHLLFSRLCSMEFSYFKMYGLYWKCVSTFFTDWRTCFILALCAIRCIAFLYLFHFFFLFYSLLSCVLCHFTLKLYIFVSYGLWCAALLVMNDLWDQLMCFSNKKHTFFFYPENIYVYVYCDCDRNHVIFCCCCRCSLLLLFYCQGT